MKNFQKLIEELDETIVNSMGGGFAVSGASENPNPSLAGYDPVMGMHRRKKKKKLKETFAGCPVFEIASEDFTKCSHGRNRYERWSKKMNMEDIDNCEIRNYVHKNPGNPIIIKDKTYGVMSYLIPRQNVNESVEVDEATKAEKKERTVQNRTARSYVRQKDELEPGPKTAKFNRLADRLDQLRRDNK